MSVSRVSAPISGSFIKSQPTVFMSGNTFPFRDYIKELGGVWNADRKEWEVVLCGTMNERAAMVSELNKMTRKGVKIEVEREESV